PHPQPLSPEAGARGAREEPPHPQPLPRSGGEGSKRQSPPSPSRHRIRARRGLDPEWDMIERFLEQVIPFRFLDRQQREALLADLREERFAAGEMLGRQGDEHDRRVFLLLEGSVDVIDRRGGANRIMVIEAGHYFGERSALFDMPRRYDLQALE